MDPVPPPPTPRWLKYLIDRILALVFTLLLAPFHLAILLAIKLEDLVTGQALASPFYLEPRVSGGKQFQVIKFRVLKPARLEALRTESGGDLKLVKHHEFDPTAVTRVGDVLRRFYLDELPQIWNVLVAHMSFVGPRPIPVIDEERLALFGQCGMRSGLAGVFQYTKGDPRPMRDRDLDYYHEYFRRGHLSLLWFDLSLMARTVIKMGKGEGL